MWLTKKKYSIRDITMIKIKLKLYLYYYNALCVYKFFISQSKLQELKYEAI